MWKVLDKPYSAQNRGFQCFQHPVIELQSHPHTAYPAPLSLTFNMTNGGLHAKNTEPTGELLGALLKPNYLAEPAIPDYSGS